MKIEYGVPIPKSRQNLGRPISEAAQLMREMKKGGSLWLKKPRSVVVAMAVKYIGRGKYESRLENGGTRIWKTK